MDNDEFLGTTEYFVKIAEVQWLQIDDTEYQRLLDSLNSVIPDLIVTVTGTVCWDEKNVTRTFTFPIKNLTALEIRNTPYSASI